MARIAIDGRKYFDFGIGTYIQQLVKALSLLNTSHEFILYASRSDVDSISLPLGWKILTAEYPKYSVSEIASFGYRAKRDGVAVFHEPHYTLPLRIRDISVVTIHDIIHLRFPEFFSRVQRAYSHAMIWHSLKHSRSVSVDSEFTKNDLLKTFHVNADKINVVHLGVGDQFRPIQRTGVVEDFRLRFSLDRPYILYVGNVKPHKGVDTLLKSFAGALKYADLDLVTVGGSLNEDDSLKALSLELNISSRVKELGRLSSDDLVAAYNAAEVLVMPSRYEGFGLPALEAMACGTPTIVSNAASLPEIAGDAALLFRVGESKELADGILQLLKSTTLKNEITAKGKKRASQFTWANTAAKTLAIYEQIIGS